MMIVKCQSAGHAGQIPHQEKVILSHIWEERRSFFDKNNVKNYLSDIE